MNILPSIKAVFWSFFGVRKRKNLEEDMQKLNPVVVIVTAFVAMALFILLLLGVVHMVVG